jgi:hypothetical protein
MIPMESDGWWVPVKPRRNEVANPSCECGHAQDGHWRRGGFCLRLHALYKGAPLCGCRQFTRRAAPAVSTRGG